VQHQCRHVRLAAPWRLELRPERGNEQNRKVANTIDRQIQQLARGRVDPMHILKDHQDRSFARDRGKLAEFLSLALWAQVELDGGIGKRQSLGNQRQLVGIAQTWGQQGFEPSQLLFRRVVAGEATGALKLNDEGVERAVLMMWRAEIAQARMRLTSNALCQHRSQP